MKCLDTCDKEKSITLVDGQTCCTSCVEHLKECEARYLLKMTLDRRREALFKRYKKRGEKSVNDLKDVILKIHNSRPRQERPKPKRNPKHQPGWYPR